MPSEKLDLYELHKDEYATPKKPQLIKVKPAKYLGITGRGAPGGEVFAQKLGALYNVAFTIKMAEKFAGSDYKVSKLEGLWWGNADNEDFLLTPREEWNWKLIIRTPDFITKKHLQNAIASLRDKGKPAEVSEVKLETIKEGVCVQMLHVGPYTEEIKSIEVMKDFARQQGLRFHGLHHEIYLSDPRRVAAERLKTILRMPVH